MLFGIAFPERLAVDRRVPWLKWIVVGYLVLVSTIEAVNVGLWVHHLALARGLQRAVELLTGREGNFGAVVSFIALVVCAGSLGYKTVTASNRDARRRLLLLDVGAGAGVVALLTILIASRLEARLPEVVRLPADCDDLGLSSDDGVAIVVHRAMDVRVVVRQGLRCYWQPAASVCFRSASAWPSSSPPRR
jgi:hypothetical protein